MRHSSEVGPQKPGTQWEVISLFGLSFGMAGLMIVGGIETVKWIFTLFR